jgi:hypothetical protein
MPRTEPPYFQLPTVPFIEKVEKFGLIRFKVILGNEEADFYSCL